ncbi:MAG: GH92 family glycosyl hydrolase, partial [Bacteroidetes bacterium]|nr:GH92 family glycosyl hydrolase [Bacteroidota bacterium]
IIVPRTAFGAFIALIPALILTLFSSCTTPSQPELCTNPVAQVDPMIGTGGHGHTFPGATVPFGMVQLSPDSRLSGWDGCSGYHYSDSLIHGFSHTHLSGTGCSDYGDILYMPSLKPYGKVLRHPADAYCYSESFSHTDEKAEPGYYEVKLNNGIQVQLSTTVRTGIQRYHYDGKEPLTVWLDLQHRDEVLASGLRIKDNKVAGFRRSKAWAEDQILFFATEFSQKPDTFYLFVNDSMVVSSETLTAKNIRVAFVFSGISDKELLIKTGISAVDQDGAVSNLIAECTNWDFDRVRAKATEAWAKELGKIQVSSENADRTKIFYTAMYHAMISPNIFSDVDGRYLGTDFKIHDAGKDAQYTVFSLWDTYRALHPLFSIIDKKRTAGFVRTFIRQYEEGGRLPMWELAGNYTGCMIGYHAVPVIADAYINGITDFDAEKALQSMISSANANRLGIREYATCGFIPAELEHESVSKTLEYAFDDWCIAMMASKMGKDDVAAEYFQRAESFRNLLNPANGFMQARSNGGWYEPFDAKEVNNNYTEANSWQYSFYAPQDIPGLIALQGGPKKFDDMLDQLFNEESKTSGREQVDITGLIGQYAHGNEPSHHIAYLYNNVKKPWKTQKMVNRIMNEMYTPKPDGLCGNEDCGQMSAWLVFSAMGFYPVAPASGVYYIGTPWFREIRINLENGKQFVVKAPRLSEKRIFIKSATLNGKPYNSAFLKYSDIAEDGILELEMKGKKQEDWGLDDMPAYTSAASRSDFIPVPYTSQSRMPFRDSLVLKLAVSNNEMIVFTLNDSVPDANSSVYSKPLVLKENTVIKARTLKAGKLSPVMEAHYYKIPDGMTVKLAHDFNPQYSAGGSEGLIDQVRGKVNWRLGGWQGYQETDFEAVVDIGKTVKLKTVALSCLQDANSWIWMPSEVEFSVSTDGTSFTKVAGIPSDVMNNDFRIQIKEFTSKINAVEARYVKVFAKNFGEIPSWHPGAGGRAFIFVDEILLTY